MAQRLMIAVVSFIVVGLVSLILFGLAVSVLDLKFQTVLPGAIVVGGIASAVGICYPKVAMKVMEILDF